MSRQGSKESAKRTSVSVGASQKDHAVVPGLRGSWERTLHRSLSSAGSRMVEPLASPSGSSSVVSRRGSFIERRTTIDTGALGSQRGSRVGDDAIAPSANSLAKKHNLPLSEVTRILLVFTEGHLSRRSIAVGFSRIDFKAVLCTYFCCKDIDDDILDSAYKAADCLEKPFDINRFLEWYVQNMFTLVSKLNASSDQYAGDKMCDELAKLHQCSVSVIARTKLQFDKFDLDRSGGIDYQEYVKMLQILLKARDGDLGDARLKKFWMEMDANGDGTVTFPEFTNWYLKYFAEGSSNGLIEALYDGYNPAQQRSKELTRRKSVAF